MQKSMNIDIGSGMVSIAMASRAHRRHIWAGGGIFRRALGMVAGAFHLRTGVHRGASLPHPGYMLKLVASVIVMLAISMPYLRRR
jgi:putative ABC transport system permease protein